MPIYLNNVKIEYTKFPAGEINLIINRDWLVYDTDGYNILTLDYISQDDLFALLLAVDAIRNLNHRISRLYIEYIPYSRQDRVCNTGEAFSLKVFANLVNSLELERVYLYDPHSDVSPALIKNSFVIKQYDLLAEVFKKNDLYPLNLTLIAPDAGAEKKTYECAKLLNLDYTVARKVRDTKTGDIIKTILHDDLTGKNVMVVDDICDGGRTFIELAKVIKEKGANKLYLYVTHGLFTKGVDVLAEHYDHIYSYNTNHKHKQLNHGE